MSDKLRRKRRLNRPFSTLQFNGDIVFLHYRDGDRSGYLERNEFWWVRQGEAKQLDIEFYPYTYTRYAMSKRWFIATMRSEIEIYKFDDDYYDMSLVKQISYKEYAADGCSEIVLHENYLIMGFGTGVDGIWCIVIFHHDDTSGWTHLQTITPDDFQHGLGCLAFDGQTLMVGREIIEHKDKIQFYRLNTATNQFEFDCDYDNAYDTLFHQANIFGDIAIVNGIPIKALQKTDSGWEEIKSPLSGLDYVTYAASKRWLAFRDKPSEHGNILQIYEYTEDGWQHYERLDLIHKKKPMYISELQIVDGFLLVGTDKQILTYEFLE